MFDLNKNLALEEYRQLMLQRAEARGVSCEALESGRDLEETLKSIDKAFEPLGGLIQVASVMRWYSEVPPPPPYDNVRFDDPREAQDFCDRVLDAHGIPLLQERVEGQGKLIRVIPHSSS